MHKSVKRQFSAWLLLLVFVPMMVAISLHIHDYNATNGVECEQCLHHVHHDGHFGAYADHIHDCVLCQFATLPFLAATTVLLAASVACSRAENVYLCENVRIGVYNVKQTRAPPAIL